jgi:hypothetical protein
MGCRARKGGQTVTSDDTSTSPQPDSATARRRRRRVALATTVLALAGETVVLASRGYGIGGNVVVRCRRGHLFTTIWIPGGSLKAIRLGWVRIQRCPVGGHWDLVTPVRLSELTDEERQSAAQDHDLRIP